MHRRGARITWVSAVALFGALLAAGPSWAGGGDHGGGGHAGGGHGFGGGGGHGFAGGGGHGFGGGFAAHAGATRGFAAAPRFGGGSFHAPVYAGHAYGGGYTGARVGGYAHAGMARAGFAGRPGFGAAYGRGYYRGAVWGHGWHPGYGWHWGGGYWGGRYWPPIFIGAAFAWYLPVVPSWCPVYWWGDVPYYYYNDVYYTWDGSDNGYVASAPPPAVSPDASYANAPIADGAPYDSAAADAAAADAAGADAPTDAPTLPASPAEGPSAAPPDSGNLYAYPKNGQSEQQQSEDQQACQRWAATHVNGSAAAGDSSLDYRRALAACLTGRGYSVD
ncbi:MAG TPA: hypothetical protein VMF64_14660 [Steroidobacteraceae bacterium]|nr:hypothetical protein [Steroidobacteraceae bacterium]